MSLLLLFGSQTGSSATLTATQPATGRIAINRTLTQAGLSRIAVARTLSQAATARIANAGVVKTQPATSRIANIRTFSQTGTARVATNRTLTQTGTARIANTGLVRTQPAVARLANTRAFTQGAIARLAQTRSLTQPSTARIAKLLVLTQPSVSRIARNLTLTQPATARVSKILTTSQLGIARLARNIPKTQLATARIANTGFVKTQATVGRIASNRIFTQGAVGRVAQNRTLIQPATARIITVLIKTQPAISRVAINRTLTQPSIAKIAVTGTITKTQPVIARIATNRTLTQPVATRIAQTLIKTQPSVAKIVTNTGVAKTQPATARLANNRSFTQGATSRIARNLTKTQPAVARLAKTILLTQSATSRVANNRTKTQTAIANITNNNVTVKTQPTIARIAKQLTNPQPATANILSTSFVWKGYTWNSRSGGGGPQYNGQWDSNNVSGPDVNGYITIKTSNPTGTSPYGGEMSSATKGWGYGTYVCVVGSRVDNLDTNFVWGNMFTYDSDTLTGNTAVSHNEIDAAETSKWGTAVAATGYNHFYNNAGVNTAIGNSVTTTSDVVMTHRMIWQPGRITYESYIGTGVGGTLLASAVQTTNLPVPALEKVYFNAWVGNFATGAANTPSTPIVLRDFSFTPFAKVLIQQATANIVYPMATLRDTLKGAVIDATKWGNLGGTISQNTSGLNISGITNSTVYPSMASNSIYDLTNSVAQIEIVDVGNQAIASWEVYPLLLAINNSYQISWIITGNTIAGYYKAGGATVFSGFVAFNSVAHRFLRIRESGGTTYWEYAATNTVATVWNSFYSVANPINMRVLYMTFAAGKYAVDPLATTAIVANFNVIPFVAAKTQPAIARITSFVTKTQPAIARISSRITATQPATATIGSIGIIFKSTNISFSAPPMSNLVVSQVQTNMTATARAATNLVFNAQAVVNLTVLQVATSVIMTQSKTNLTVVATNSVVKLSG